MLAAVGLSLHRPFTEPVIIFALAMLIFLGAPRLVERFKVPGVVGVILAGALVGPHGFHLIERNQTIVLLGTVGLIYLMFLAGTEIDLQGFRRYRGRSIGFGALSFLTPQVLGTAVGHLLGFGWPSALLLGALLASHTLLAYPQALRFGIAKNEAVTVSVGGTMIADTAALLVLAVIAASEEGGLGAGFWTRLIVSLAVFAGIILLVLPRVARWFFRREAANANGTFVFVLAMLFLGALLAMAAGVEAIVGAFLVGLAFNRLIPAGGSLSTRIHFVGEAFFIPFFMLWVGMLVDVRILFTGPRTWLVMGLLLLVGIGAKWGSAWVTGKAFDYSRDEVNTIAGLSIPRASATLAIALIGHDLGLFDEVVENGVILLMMVTCFLGPSLVERHGRALALEAERSPARPADAPRRILVPMANPGNATSLLDLAMLVRRNDATEPLYALTVVPEDGSSADEHVANAEKMLSHAVAHAAGADVPVQPVTRVDQNFANGIARAAVETRSSTVVVGWDGRTSRRWMFGDVLDQMLGQTSQQVVVARLGHPLNTTRRITFVIPRGADHAAGFFTSVRMVKLLASRLTVPVTALVVETDPDVYRKQLDPLVPTDVPFTYEGVADWSQVLPWLRERTEARDLVVVLAARRNTIAWHSALLRLPARLARLSCESFLMVYPGARGDNPREPLGATGLARALTAERVVVPLAAEDYDGAVAELLDKQYHGNRRLMKTVSQTLRRQGAPLVIAPGVVIPHARMDALSEPMAFLGVTHGDGFAAPEAPGPVWVIVLVLSPADQPNAHLAVLADIARGMAAAGRVERLRAAGDAEQAQAALLG